MQTKLARFTKKVVTLAQRAVVGNSKPAPQRGNGGYVDKVTVSIHGIKSVPRLDISTTLNVLHEMPRTACVLSLDVPQSPGFSATCMRM